MKKWTWLTFAAIALWASFVWVAYGQEEAPAPRQPQWEYAILCVVPGVAIKDEPVKASLFFDASGKENEVFPKGKIENGENVLKTLNKIGAAGWELIQIGPNDRYTIYYYFKRQVR